MANHAVGQDALVGQRLGHYRIIEQIGSGGMGVVYRAHDEHLDREIAIKVLRSGTLADESRRKHFRKEALALSKLNHPNIATIHDFDTEQDMDFLVMEYIPGVTLNDKLAEASLPEKQVVALGVQLAEGLSTAHEHAVVHRDLKPGNLRITTDGRVKILDFGLAKLRASAVASPASETLSEMYSIAGTLPYMAPEQVLGGEIDARTDIHAAGAVLYEMATGQRAFPTVDRSQLTRAILRRSPRPAGSLNPRLSPELSRIIGKCLEKEPEDRYQSAKELAIDLRRLQSGVVSGVQPTAAARRWGSATAAGIGLLGLACVTAVLLAFNVGKIRQKLLGPGEVPRIESLAVLPLQNLSGDKEQDYFADGMTDELITNLAKISNLRVISRTSVMQYKGTKKPLPQIGRELDVDAVVEGSVLRAGNRVRITAQLIQASTDRHLWAETYDRDLRDVLALQNDVAAAIGGEVQAKLTSQDQKRLASARPVNPEAYQAYLKARYFSAKWTAEGNRKCAEYSQQAIGLDPTYAPAHATLASCYTSAATSGDQLATEAYPKAKAAAEKALQLDDTLAEAHAVSGSIKLGFDWDWSGAEQEFKRAVELNPNSFSAHLDYGLFLTAMGRPQEAVRETETAVKLDPLTPTTHLQLGWVLYYARRHDDSIAQLRKTLEMDPNLGYAHMELGWNYAQKRMYPEAILECRTAISQTPQNQVVLGSCGGVYGLAGKHQDALLLLSPLQKISAEGYLDPYNVASLYDGLGDNDHAMEWLTRAYREHSASLYGLRIETWTKGLRSDPRFQELLRRMNFPQWIGKRQLRELRG
jgi:eukaryotic-like serine/threonine-protein kinase